MRVQKLFWADPYATQCRATILGVDGQDVRLDASVFFAFSGGQESDTGTIGGYAVANARKDGLNILYTLPPGHALRVGDTVDVVIDGVRRLGLMRHHFAAETVLQLVYRHCPGIPRIGAHITPDKARIDFETETSLSALVPVIEAEANRLVQDDRPILTAFSDEASERRFWKVEGFAHMACGGTHPRSTGEVGRIVVKRRNPGKGKERLEIVATLPA